MRAFVEHDLAFFLQSHLSDYGLGIINQTNGYGLLNAAEWNLG